MLRKALAYGLILPKTVERMTCRADSYGRRPPIIVNSIPKSGTHLLLQIVNAVPRVRYLGGFIATTPSWTLKERSPAILARKIRALVPGEVVAAHIFHSPEVVEAMRAVNAIHLFIYRDPRDVLLSEAHYLGEMNRWHRMHPVFASIEDRQGRIELAINGLDKRYPRCDDRIKPYLGWLDDGATLAVKYEDLVGRRQTDELLRIARRLHRYTPEPATLVPILKNAIRPDNSHTFHEGGTQKWRAQMSVGNLTRTKAVLGPIIEKMGYDLSCRSQ